MIVLVGIRAGYMPYERWYTHLKGCDVCGILATVRFVNLLFFIFFQLAQALHSLAVKPRTRRPAARCVCVGVSFFACALSLIVYNSDKSNTVQSTPLLKDTQREKTRCKRTFPVQQRNASEKARRALLAQRSERTCPTSTVLGGNEHSIGSLRPPLPRWHAHSCSLPACLLKVTTTMACQSSWTSLTVLRGCSSWQHSSPCASLSWSAAPTQA